MGLYRMIRKKASKEGNASTKSTPRDSYRVIRTKHTRNGSESLTEDEIIGEYFTREQANEAAWNIMGSTYQFDGWGENKYANKPPPYSSAEGPQDAIRDEVELVDICVLDSNTGEAAENDQLDSEIERAYMPHNAAKVVELLDPLQRHFGKTYQTVNMDDYLFARNPCCIDGGVNRHPRDYPFFEKANSFAYLMQRLSDRNYAMRSFCLDGYGASYNMIKMPDGNELCAWLPKSNLNDHATDETILDGCHLDLINPKSGETYLTSTNLQSAICKAGPSVECLFLNGAQTNGQTIAANDIALAISKCCSTLKCIGLTECELNAPLLNALASCNLMRGVILENCLIHYGQADDDVATDQKLAAVLRSCPNLGWCFVKASIFGEECWNALAEEGGCPNLEVLWVDASTSNEDRIDFARGDHDTIRFVLNSRADNLKICMINPDDEMKSRYIIGGAENTDRLDGRDRPSDLEVT